MHKTFVKVYRGRYNVVKYVKFKFMNLDSGNVVQLFSNYPHNVQFKSGIFLTEINNFNTEINLNLYFYTIYGFF